MKKYKRWIIALVLFPLMLIFLNLAVAYIKSIANYFITREVIDQGGGTSQSINFKLTDAIGQPSGIGVATSTNYKESSGFFSGGGVAPMLSVVPTTLDFGTAENNKTFQISNVGGGTLTWTATESPDKPWITSVSPASGSSDATVTVTVDRSLLAVNSDTGTLAINSNGGNINLTVLISKPVGGVIISAPNVSGSAGSTVDIPISVTDLTGKNVAALTLVVETQTSVLTPTGATTTGTILGAWGSVLTNIVGGRISISGADVNPLSGSGILIILHYQVNTGATSGLTSAIDLVSALLNEGDPPVSTQDGLFTVSAGYNISGTVLYHQNSNPVDNTAMTLNGNTTTTGTDGSFSFTSVSGGNLTLTPSKTGDLGTSISAFDASMILRYSVGLVTLMPYQLIAADVSGNGSVSAFDASYILRYMVGLITSFPAGTEWRFVPNSFVINTSNWNTAPHSINYTPLNSDQTNQDFTGIVIGDVTGNWSFLELAKNITGSATIDFGEVVHLSQKKFAVPIKANLNGKMYSTKITVQFDSEVLIFKGVILNDKLKDFTEFHHLEDGNLTIGLAGALGINSLPDLVWIKFEAKQDGNKRFTELNIIDVVMNEGQIAVNINESNLSLNPTLPSSHQLEQNYPNPFNPTTTIGYGLSKSADVKLTIFDLNGKLVRQLIHQSQTAGYHLVAWEAKDDLGVSVASGIYFYRLEVTESGKHKQPFMRVRKMVLMK